MTADLLARVRALVGSDARHDSRFRLLEYALDHEAFDQTSAARSLGQAPSSVRLLLRTLEREGLVTADESGPRPLFSATPEARAITAALMAVADTRLGTRLQHRILLSAGHPVGTRLSETRMVLEQGAKSIMTGVGDFDYVGVFDDDPEAVGDARARLESAGVSVHVFRVSRVD